MEQFQNQELDYVVDDYYDMTDFEDDDVLSRSRSSSSFSSDDSVDSDFEDDFDVSKPKTDTSAIEARNGKDIQGIPWERLNFTREKYCESRLRQYKNYDNLSGSREDLSKVPFEVLVRRQIPRLLDPSLQCARFIFDELMKMSHCCMVNELQRFPVLSKHVDEVIGNFLREGFEASETMFGHIIEMEMDYINTSHPNFVGGSKAVELAIQQPKLSRIGTPIARQKDPEDFR